MYISICCLFGCVPCIFFLVYFCSLRIITPSASFFHLDYYQLQPMSQYSTRNLIPYQIVHLQAQPSPTQAWLWLDYPNLKNQVNIQVQHLTNLQTQITVIYYFNCSLIYCEMGEGIFQVFNFLFFRIFAQFLLTIVFKSFRLTYYQILLIFNGFPQVGFERFLKQFLIRRFFKKSCQKSQVLLFLEYLSKGVCYYEDRERDENRLEVFQTIELMLLLSSILMLLLLFKYFPNSSLQPIENYQTSLCSGFKGIYFQDQLSLN